ncbi:uncharacterized protein LOC143033097 [Oratosquilla oratoria]|uniref:uncharacterized protein LOC143033097 n=1 Tax=Oratosquilla oratoria TaxID=337810 RepID=UPI003F764913
MPWAGTPTQKAELEIELVATENLPIQCPQSSLTPVITQYIDCNGHSAHPRLSPYPNTRGSSSLLLGKMIVALAVVVCLAASSANAAVGRTVPKPVDPRRPNMCPHKSGYVADGGKVPHSDCLEEICDVDNGMYQFHFLSCPPAPPLGDPFCTRVLRDEPYPNCCPHAAFVVCS